MSEYSNEEQDLINQINRKKGGGFKFFDDSTLKFIHDKIVGKTFRVNEKTGKNPNTKPVNKPNQSSNVNQKPHNNPPPKSSDPVQNIISHDKQVREAVQNLYLSLKTLGDKDIAKKLIYEHIMMLNEIFKDFE